MSDRIYCWHLAYILQKITRQKFILSKYLSNTNQVNLIASINVDVAW